MLHLRRHLGNAIGVLALLALIVPATVMAEGLSVRAQMIQSAAAPIGGAVTQQELPGCSNPSEPFAGASQGCGENPLYEGGGFMDNPLYDEEAARGPRQTTSLDGTYDPKPPKGARGPRQTTSLDGSFINPETGAMSRTYAVCQRRVSDTCWRAMSFPERGPTLDPTPTYNSALASTAGVMGYGWSFPYSMSLRIFRGTATITQENGSQVVFKRATGSKFNGTQFHGAPRVIASFEQTSDGSYTLTRGSTRSTCPSYLLQSCETFTFSKGRLRSIGAACKSKEVCGNGIVDIKRDSAGRPTSATADSGDSLKFGYTSGHITSITGPGGVSEHFTYDSKGNLASATDPNGNTTQYGYDKLHRMTRARLLPGRTTTWDYSSSGRVTSMTDALGNQRGFTYNAIHHNTRIVSPEGRGVVLAYQDSTVVDLRAAGPGGPPLAEWTFAYDPRTLALTKTVDPNLGVMTAVSDADGMPLALTDALGKTTTFTYSDTGRRSSVTDPMGVKTKFTYDENGNVLSRSTPVTSSGTTRVRTWISVFEDPAHPGDMTSSIDPLGNETDYTYDSRGNPASVTDPLGNTWTYSIKKACFNKSDPRVARRGGGSTPDATITDPLGHTTSYTCDANGNLLATTDATGATTTNTYDADNELTSTTDPAGRKTTYSYDADGQLTAVHMPDGSASRATYGADGELSSTIDPAGGTRSFTYDALGRRATDTDQLGRKTTFTYDAVGDLTSTTDPSGVTSTYTYDADRRVLETKFLNGSIPTEEDFAYDLDGRRTSMTDGTGTTTYQYDSVGRTTSTQDSFGDVIDSDFDLRGDRTSITYPNGHTVTMQYDGNGQMTAVSDWLGNTTHFQYDRAGRRIRMIVLRVGFTGGKTTAWAYNAADQINLLQSSGANGNPYSSFHYDRATDGRIIGVQSTGLSDPDHSYSYGIQARLGSYDGSPVTFDSRNNVTRLPDGSTLGYDAGDQLTSMLRGGLVSTFSYDADGRRTGSGSAASALSYGWDAAGDLSSFTANGSTTTYTTNGDGQRVGSSSGGVPQTFVWDARVVCSTDKVNKTAGENCDAGLLSDGTNSYIYGPDGLPIEQIDNADHALFLDEDAQGSVRLLTDADGNVKGTASYDAFGNQTAQSGETSPFGYEGMYRDAESGLYAMSCGVYDPATGQHLTQSRNCTASCKINVCGDGKIIGSTPGAVTYKGVWMVGAPRSGEGCGNGLRTEFAILRKREQCDDGNSYSDLRVGDGVDEDCNGHEALCVESPYGADGGDPVNAMVTRAVLKQFFVKGAGS